MKQEELQEQVRELFEKQGFEVTGKNNELTARNDAEISIRVYASEKYDIDEIRPSEGILVFVDEPLQEIQDKLKNDVSVIKEEKERKEYELPSYELIGEIAIINELEILEEEAVEGILAHHSHVKTILVKEDGLKGEFRVGDYRKIYGDETETVHKEFGCRYIVDPTKVYFSERFGTERDRVTSQIKSGERVLVMFAGVGPFALLAAKRGASKVVAVEKNPVAADYMKRNVELNKFGDVIEPLEGDVIEVVPDLDRFDRVIMPLPESADRFLELAIQHTADQGVLHYYRFLDNENWKPIEAEIEEAAKSAGVECSIIGRTVCGHKSPAEDRVCVDIEIHR